MRPHCAQLSAQPKLDRANNSITTLDMAVETVTSLPISKRKALTSHGPEMSFVDRVKIRTLYMQEGLSGLAISKELKLHKRTVYGFIQREGLPDKRRELEAKLEKQANDKQENDFDRVSSLIASHCETHALDGLKRVGESLRKRCNEKSAKQFQAYTAGVRNLATTARALRHIGSLGTDQGPALNLNLFFAMTAPETEEKGVIDVTPSEAVRSQ